MNSPFPGMDPFIEESALWPDFHDDLIAEIKRSLAAQLPERYFVQTGERSYVVLAGIDEKEEKPIYADVGIEKSAARGRAADRGGAVAVAEPEADVGTLTM